MSSRLSSSSATSSQRVLITGGLGYLGSHVAAELARSSHTHGGGMTLDLLDDGSNCHATDVLPRLQSLASGTSVTFNHIKVDITNAAAVANVVQSNRYDGFVHCAGMKDVAQCKREPLTCFAVNVTGTHNLLAAIAKHVAGPKVFVYVSSAMVYDDPTPAEALPEAAPLQGKAGPYVASVIAAENLVRAVSSADSSWRAVTLRCSNLAGAHTSGLLADAPPRGGSSASVVSSLVAVAANAPQAASGRQQPFTLHRSATGSPDGSERDWLHVMDAAAATRLVLYKGMLGQLANYDVYNIGSGVASSVQDLVSTMQTVVGSESRLPVHLGARRLGDVPKVHISTTKALRQLGWAPRRKLRRACEDAWFFNLVNSEGIKTAVPRVTRAIQSYHAALASSARKPSPVTPAPAAPRSAWAGGAASTRATSQRATPAKSEPATPGLSIASAAPYGNSHATSMTAQRGFGPSSESHAYRRNIRDVKPAVGTLLAHEYSDAPGSRSAAADAVRRPGSRGTWQQGNDGSRAGAPTLSGPRTDHVGVLMTTEEEEAYMSGATGGGAGAGAGAGAAGGPGAEPTSGAPPSPSRYGSAEVLQRLDKQDRRRAARPVSSAPPSAGNVVAWGNDAPPMPRKRGAGTAGSNARGYCTEFTDGNWPVRISSSTPHAVGEDRAGSSYRTSTAAKGQHHTAAKPAWWG